MIARKNPGHINTIGAQAERSIPVSVKIRASRLNDQLIEIRASSSDLDCPRLLRNDMVVIVKVF